MKKQGTDVLFDLNVVVPIDLKLSVRFLIRVAEVSIHVFLLT